ncbi:uncharacterized protein [Rutidosis leptorrhynchoides]|uniref:uncharacterized protein n=1 Tax=Rutidosis leptorrhynchoides TaxID=125765 RepID=UPI003A993B63
MIVEIGSEIVRTSDFGGGENENARKQTINENTGVRLAVACEVQCINILDTINFATLAWRFDVKETTIANCFRHCKIRSEELDVPEAEVEELEEDIEGLTDVISKLQYRNVMDVEHLLNYPNENDVVMELPTDDEIIESVLNDENDPEPDDSSVTQNVSSKEAYQAVITLRNYFLQHEQNNLQVLLALGKIKNEMNFGGKKKQKTIDSFFVKE